MEASEMSSTAHDAAQDFATRFSARQIPADLPKETIGLPEGGLGLLELLCRLDFASSNSEARRLVQQRKTVWVFDWSRFPRKTGAAAEPGAQNRRRRRRAGQDR
jgi:hypothetical protein